jgi:hypothetical protein
MANEIDISQSDSFTDPPETSSTATKIAYAGLLGYGATKLGKRLVGRSIDTLGFGGNVAGSYASESKIAQLTNNLLTAGKGKTWKMPIEFLKQLKTTGNPIELKAVKTSLGLLEQEMSELKSAGKRIPKKLSEYYNNLLEMDPKRRMASAIKERAFRQTIGFKHGGKFIEGKFPQADPDIRRFLKNKGLNVNKPIPVFDISHEKNYMKSLRGMGTDDPRVKEITKALKENRLKDAKRIAKKGLIKHKGQIIKSGRPLKLIKTADGYVLKFVPSWVDKGGKLHSYKDFVIGGHTQRIQFGKYKGLLGFHKKYTDIIDITTYTSAGEKGGNIVNRARTLLAGSTGQKAGIFDPVVTRGGYAHRRPGGGRTAGATDAYRRKGSKHVAAGIKKYATKTEAWKKLLKSLAKGIVTRGRRW